VCLFTKVVVTFDAFPYWGSDPTRVLLPATGLTPGPGMILDCISLIACGLALIGESLAGAPLKRWLIALWGIGTVSVVIHATSIHAGTLDDARIGLSWSAALAAGLTAFHLCRDPSLRRITLATAVGITGALIAKGVLQYFVEQPATVKTFREDGDAFLIAQGWTPGSTAARAFIRRLDQDEATGWFGMANVYASFMAAGLVAMLGWTVLAWKQTRNNELPSGWSGLLSLGAVLCAAGVAMAGSKGGVGACLVGMALLAAGALVLRIIRAATPGSAQWMPAARIARLGGPLAVAIFACGLLAVIARGLIGDRLNRIDLSLLFRWHYMIGAARIAAHHPLMGVGPANFKEAYMLAKPPVSPEDVASPHSTLLDYVATLGLFGLAWAALIIAWVWGAGSRLTSRVLQTPEGDAPSDPARPELWAIALLVFIPSLAGAFLERTLASPDVAITRLVSIAAWLGLACAAHALMRTRVRWRWIIAAAAIAVALHGQIEMTGTWPGAADLFMLILGAAAAPDIDLFSERRRTDLAWASTPFLAGLAALPSLALPAFRWERDLAASADAVRPMAEINTRLSELANRRAPASEFAAVARDLASALNIDQPTTPSGLELATAELLIRTSTGALPALESAVHHYPSHFLTTEALVRLLLSKATAEQLRGHAADMRESLRVAESLATDFAERAPSAAAYGLVGNTEFTASSVLSEPDRLEAAAKAWEHAADMDPYGPVFALKAFDIHAALGHADRARIWATEVLARDQLQYLDPLRRLTDDERKRVNAALATRPG
jgi:hypothetical protein